jgi:hypothetical protein
MAMTNIAQLLAICIARSIDPRTAESQITPSGIHIRKSGSGEFFRGSRGMNAPEAKHEATGL